MLLAHVSTSTLPSSYLSSALSGTSVWQLSTSTLTNWPSVRRYKKLFACDENTVASNSVIIDVGRTDGRRVAKRRAAAAAAASDGTVYGFRRWRQSSFRPTPTSSTTAQLGWGRGHRPARSEEGAVCCGIRLNKSVDTWKSICDGNLRQIWPRRLLYRRQHTWLLYA